MLPIATVRWSKRELIAQGPDAAWETLRQRLVSKGFTNISDKISRELNRPIAGVIRRRITFNGHEILPVVEAIGE